MSRQPRTETGRRLAANLALVPDILAIEDEGLDAGLSEAKRRLSVVGMHDGKCPEPDEPCTCGLAAAIDNAQPTPWYTPEIEP